MAGEQQTLRDFLTAQARRREKKIFLEHGGRQYSYAATDDRTDRVATGLSRLGLRAGDRVALLLSNSPELVFFLLGAPKLGIIPVPIDPGSSPEQVISILWHCGATAVISQRQFGALRRTAPQILHWISVDEESFAGPPFYGLTEGSVLGFWPDLDSHATALISYARGKPGARRAVALSHGNLLGNCSQILQPFRIDETDRFLCAIPLNDAAALVLLVLAPWAAGGTCILAAPDWAQLPREIEESCATVIAGPPDFFGMMSSSADFDRCDLSSLRLAVSHSGPIDPEVYRRFGERHDALLVEGYGPVEATCLTCANPYTGVLKAGSLGHALPGVECRIVDEKGDELPAGQTGEIVVRGPHVMKEYFRDPEGTMRAIRGGWLHTGDRGFIDSEGYYYLAASR